METISAPTYTILGGDGNRYGPVTAEQFRDWVRQGRANAQSQVLRSDVSDWRAAATFPELGMAADVPPPMPAVEMASVPGDLGLEQRLRSGASWFYWIAALSLINSFLWMTNAGFGFAIGLGITREIDHAFARSPMVAFAIDALAAGIIALFGFFALKRQQWAFIVGMVLLALDTVLTLLQQQWIRLAFHAWALGSIFMAFQACRKLRC